jgi:hypothetical protein
MSNEIQIVAVSQSSRDITRFLEVSYPIFEKDPNWLPAANATLKGVHHENPLFQHARMQLWIRQGQRDGDGQHRDDHLIAPQRRRPPL